MKTLLKLLEKKIKFNMQATCIMYRSANICFQLICDKRSFRYIQFLLKKISLKTVIYIFCVFVYVKNRIHSVIDFFAFIV